MKKYLVKSNTRCTFVMSFGLSDEKLKKMKAPTTIAETLMQDNVLRLTRSMNVDTMAAKWFRDIMDTKDTVSVNKLFTEGGRGVWEAYTDSGSIDYLYLIK